MHIFPYIRNFCSIVTSLPKSNIKFDNYKLSYQITFFVILQKFRSKHKYLLMPSKRALNYV